jgi:hypothetical protein
MLRNTSFWDVKTLMNFSWSWKKILNLRGIIQDMVSWLMILRGVFSVKESLQSRDLEVFWHKLAWHWKIICYVLCWLHSV